MEKPQPAVVLFPTLIIGIEKVFLNNLILRHFVTDKKNFIYEDEEGAIYISADKKGIYKMEFTDFR